MLNAKQLKEFIEDLEKNVNLENVYVCTCTLGDFDYKNIVLGTEYDGISVKLWC